MGRTKKSKQTKLTIAKVEPTEQVINLVKEYEQYLVSSNLAETTIRSYTNTVEKFLVMHGDLTRENVLSYIGQMNETNLSATTINQRLNALKNYNEYLVETEQDMKNYIFHKDFIKIQSEGNPCHINEKDLRKMLDKLETVESVHDIRNKAIVYLLLNTGIRREELCNLKIGIVSIHEREIEGLLGKGKKKRDVILFDDCIPFLKDYLGIRNERYARYAESEYLFISERGEKLNPESVNDIFKMYSKTITPHDLRHYFASIVAEQNIMELKALQQQLGHASLNTTGIYINPRKEVLKNRIKGKKII